MWPLWLQILGWLLIVIIIIGNGLVIYLITTRRKLRTKTNWFVLSLAVADFGVGTTSSYDFAYKIHKPMYAHHFKRRIVYQAIRVFFISASILSLCVLTLDRYLAIVKPMRYVNFMTTKRVALLISAAWSVPFVAVLIPRLTLNLATSGKALKTIRHYFWVFHAIPTICVCVFLLFATTRIFLVARRHARQNAALITQLKFNHRIQHGRVFKPQEAAATKMVGVVVAVFLSCYLLFVFHHISNMAGFEAHNKDRRMVSRLLLLLNSAVNPVAYALFKREIRKELKRLFCNCGRQR